MLDAEADALKKRIQDYVTNLTAMAGRPKEEVLEEQKRLRDQMQALGRGNDADSRKKMQELRTAYAKVANAYQWDLGFALRAAPNAAASLASGATLFASTKKGEALPLPASAIPQFQTNVLVPGPDGKPRSELRSPNGAVMVIRLNPVTGELATTTMATGLGDSAAGGVGGRRAILDTGEVEAMLKDEPLKKRLREWARDDNGSVLAHKLASPPAAKAAGYAQRAYSLADHLEYLADTAGIPVVADAFRLPVSSEQYMNAPTVGEYIRSLRDLAMPPTRSGYFRTDKGWLMARHPHYWRQLAREIPESALEPLEAKAAAGQMPTLDDYAAFAGSLTPWQALAFADFPPLTRFPRLPLVNALPGLRVWASLNTSQREDAYGDGLSIQAMTPQQQDLYRAAALSLLWQRPVKESFLPLLMHGDRNSDLRFFYRNGESGYQAPLAMQSEAIEEGNKRGAYSADEVLRLRERSVGFILGVTVEKGESFGLVLPVKE
jgi:hypothetical protein